MPSNSPRREFLDTVLSVSAAIVALSALVVTTYQTKIMREQQKMSAWPRVEQSNIGGNEHYGRMILNEGVGPALVRSATLSANGRPLHTWEEVLRTVITDSSQIDSIVVRSKTTTSSVQRGKVLLPGSTTDLIRADAPLAAPLRRFFNSERTRMRVCYCSVCGDCWVSDNRTKGPDPVEVSSCPDDPSGEFAS